MIKAQDAQVGKSDQGQHQGVSIVRYYLVVGTNEFNGLCF